MSTTSTRRIQQIATDDLSNLNPGQIGYTTVDDDVMGKRVFGGMNDLNEVSVFIEKDQNARLKNTTLTSISLSGSPQTPLNIVANIDRVDGYDTTMSSVILSASHAVGYNGNFEPGPGGLLYEGKSFIVDFPEISHMTQGTGAVCMTMKNASDTDLVNTNRKSTISMVQNKVLINAYDSSDIEEIISSSSTFASLTLVYDSRNAYSSGPLSWWNIGTRSDGDLIFQTGYNGYGEEGQLRLTSAGTMVVSNGFMGRSSLMTYASSGAPGYDAENVFAIPVLATSAYNSDRLNELTCSMFVTNKNPNTLYIRVKGDDGNLRVGSIALST